MEAGIEEDKNIKELTPNNNSDFTIIIDFTKKMQLHLNLQQSKLNALVLGNLESIIQLAMQSDVLLKTINICNESVSGNKI